MVYINSALGEKINVKLKLDIQIFFPKIKNILRIKFYNS